MEDGTFINRHPTEVEDPDNILKDKVSPEVLPLEDVAKDVQPLRQYENPFMRNPCKVQAPKPMAKSALKSSFHPGKVLVAKGGLPREGKDLQDF